MEVFAEALLNTCEMYFHENVKPIEKKEDRGVDLMARRPQDTLRTSIQVKYTADMKRLHSWDELSTFYGKSTGTRRLLITAGKGMATACWGTRGHCRRGRAHFGGGRFRGVFLGYLSQVSMRWVFRQQMRALRK